MIQCSHCNTYKHEHEYYKDKKQCKACHRVKKRLSYYFKSSEDKRITAERQEKRRKENMLKIMHIKMQHGCIDCGNKNPLHLDFDHQHSKKKNISNMNTDSWENIELEISKCEIRCSNCHRTKTHRENNSFTYTTFMSMCIEDEFHSTNTITEDFLEGLE